MTVQDSSPPNTLEGIDWVVLNAESRPDKLARFQTTHAHLPFAVEVVPATNAAEVDPVELMQIDLLDRESSDWSADALAQALSHWMCWHQSVETQRPVCVLEDDAVLRHDVASRLPGLLRGIPAGWDLIQLGYDTFSAIDFQITPDCRFFGRFSRPSALDTDVDLFAAGSDPVAPFRMFTAFGTFAYIVSPVGAQKLIDSCFPLATRVARVAALRGRIRSTTIDAVMNLQYAALEAYVSFPPLALSRVLPAKRGAAEIVEEAEQSQ